MEMDLDNPVFQGYINDIERCIHQIRASIKMERGNIYKEVLTIKLRAEDIDGWLDRMND